MTNKEPEDKKPPKNSKSQTLGTKPIKKSTPGKTEARPLPAAKKTPYPGKVLDPSRLPPSRQLVTIEGKQYTQKTLGTKSKEELLELILKLNSEVERITSRLPDESIAPSFKIDVPVEEYVQIPVKVTRKRDDMPEAVWRIVLFGSDPGLKPLGLEVRGDVVIGRTLEEAKPDLDLTKYDAEKKGVSRRHAILHPTSTGLFLIDLRSTNQTLCNSVSLNPGALQRLSNGDTISFGQLHFKIHITRKPESA